MECDSAREAISARIDGEDPGVPDGALEAHLAGCEACQGWQQRAHVMTRRARLGGPFLDRDLTSRVLAAIPPVRARRRLRLAMRAALLVAALGQLAVTVPLLILGHDHEAGTHAAHELGSFDLALAIAFAVGAIRPALSAGLAWTCGIAAAGLAGTAIADLIGGQTIGADEAQHLIAVAGAMLLLWQARTADTGIAGAGTAGVGTAGATDWPQAAPSPGAAGPGAVSRLAGPQHPLGGGAARGGAPDTARVSPAGGLPDGADQVGADQGLDSARLSRPRRDSDGREAVA
jgi:predicted anti-sigma-YlaC factor YlaD